MWCRPYVAVGHPAKYYSSASNGLSVEIPDIQKLWALGNNTFRR